MEMDIDDILADLDRGDLPLEAEDLRSLTRLWIAERVAPELMPWPQDLIKRMMDRISKQIELVEEKTGSIDPKTNFILIIMQTELERYKFLVRSFLRARLAKIDAHPLYYAEPPLSDNLSASESQYLQTHQSLLTSHYSASFLAQFPTNLQRMDDTAGGISMVDTPDLDKAVFIRVLDDTGGITIPGADIRCNLEKGDIWVLRWSAIKDIVERGNAELI